MPDQGHINGVPVGPVLPDPVPCEGCGGPVYWTEDGQAPVEGGSEWASVRGVWERDLIAEGQTAAMPGVAAWAWALKPHVCPLQVRALRRRGLLTGEPIEDDDDEEG